ncbi:related to iron transport multicopper oxidase fio1 precursor [Ramularia collo-cygni]|uniref:Related to iron transport multicopper oxidase fio1 n=1 Tax=Ramularia collo-cygni TaxID=112498 RepID=A0A2D3VH67_9PEZI|nr:related to iron transport multicopper oxidase fio1 precursor [Ramularia collo-cygni]CZT25385.1 related to iron transport multicopper oxidase fio1 precursor [Ramularia collo-cygni]
MRLSQRERDSSRSSGNETEQIQSLLMDWRGSDVEELSENEKHQKLDQKEQIELRSGFCIPRLWFFISMAIIILLALGTIASLNLSKGDTQSLAQAPSGISTPDYTLDPNWDFHAPAQRREYSWTVRDHEHNPDGVYRPMILVNSQFPGPLIEVNEGDTIVVNVHNEATNATSFHWHGIYQNGSSFMDGAVGTTTCPIAPGHNFTYQFTVKQSGSYFWHSHQGVQSSDGLHGPLIIHGRDEKEKQRIPYKTDRVILLADHYHDLSSALLWQYLKPDEENAEPVPVGGLINGRSIRDCESFPGRKCDNSTTNVGTPRLTLERNESHRLRFINVGALAEFQVQINEHELAVTEVDGTDVEPSTYHRVNINPAQRYSVVVNTNSATSESFWMLARMITTCFAEVPANLDANALAIVQYVDDPNELPSSTDWETALLQECKDMNTTELIPLDVVAAPVREDAFFYLRSNFEIGKYRLSRGKFNTSTFRPEVNSPSLHRAIDGLATLNMTFRPDTTSSQAFVNDQAYDISRELVIQTTGIQTIDILVSNFDDGSHPMHLHGYKYFVLAQGHGYPPLTSVSGGINRENLAPLYDQLDLTNPLRRDTATVEAFGWMLIRIVADNPGAWTFHCHLAWHSEAGLAMQFLTRSDELAKVRVPQANLDLCAAHGIEKGMGPEDEDYRDLAK